MLQVKQGSIWKTECDGRVIPVNATPRNHTGEAILNNSDASILCLRWPSFAWQLCLHHEQYGLKVNWFEPFTTISFPIRYDPMLTRISLGLIEKSAIELAELVEKKELKNVVLPLAGLCGDDPDQRKEVQSILKTWLTQPVFTLLEGPLFTLMEEIG